MKYDTLIFDIDGVLVDTRQSFANAVVDAVVYGTGSDRFTKTEIAALKSIRGFNNDWWVAVAGAYWAEFLTDLPFGKYIQNLDELGGGLEGLKQMCPDLSQDYQRFLMQLTMEAYGGTTACRRLYGFEPEAIRIPGHWRNERPLITSKRLRTIQNRAGIITGRTRSELELALELLNWTLSDDLIAWSDNPALDKPNPVKLMEILRKLKAVRPVYIGDSRDDLELVKNYRKATGKPLDFCLVGSENRINGYDLAYANVNDFLNDIGVEHG